MSIKRPVLKQLFALSCNSCAYPRCGATLMRRDWDEPLARICHIRAQSSGGPRFDPSYEDVDGFDNLMILCPNHHTQVDDLQPAEYPVEVLEEMKAAHELRCQDAFRANWWEHEEVDLDAVVTAVLQRLSVTGGGSQVFGTPTVSAEVPAPTLSVEVPAPTVTTEEEPPPTPVSLKLEGRMLVLENRSNLILTGVQVEPVEGGQQFMLAAIQGFTVEAGGEANVGSLVGPVREAVSVFRISWSGGPYPRSSHASVVG